MTQAGDGRTITTTLTLTDEDLAQLREALGLGKDADLTDFLSSVAKVSAEMLLTELLGRADYPTKSAARQARLLGLALNAFEGSMPSASVVAGLFHLTPTAASTLLTTTAARYRTDLWPARYKTAAAALRGKVERDVAGETAANNDYKFACTDGAVIATLKEILSASECPIQPLEKSAKATNVYELHASAVEVLEARLDLSLEEMLIPEQVQVLKDQLAKDAKKR